MTSNTARGADEFTKAGLVTLRKRVDVLTKRIARRDANGLRVHGDGGYDCKGALLCLRSTRGTYWLSINARTWRLDNGVGGRIDSGKGFPSEPEITDNFAAPCERTRRNRTRISIESAHLTEHEEEIQTLSTPLLCKIASGDVSAVELARLELRGRLLDDGGNSISPTQARAERDRILDW